MKRLKKFAYKPFRALTEHLKTVPVNHDTETLHQVRIDIKKIKAVLNLIHETRKKFRNHKRFLPFRAIFRKADAIRQSEVLTSLLTKYPEEGLQLPPTEHPPLETFESKVPNYLQTVKAQSEKLKPYLKKIKDRDIGRYLKHQYKKIQSKLYPHLALKDIHKTRKSIKAALFIAGSTDHLKKKKEKFYDTLQEAIGNLHDKQLLLQLLKKNDNDRHHHRALRTACAHDIRQIRGLAAGFYG
ncbi:CHAD domain-containing protein [Chryseolinea soli]|uniref:CHAD domain-containing protein n=1 Tax=Chryseolinea soli TaxID=2321403 RepID=A0A385SWS9_9BACT|nr:CHAD domain-containing protein [Chryseolinea soli]AYB35036.1 CHAD domain-containing protein [Chryseolinea soli]